MLRSVTIKWPNPVLTAEYVISAELLEHQRQAEAKSRADQACSCPVVTILAEFLDPVLGDRSQRQCAAVLVGENRYVLELFDLEASGQVAVAKVENVADDRHVFTVIIGEWQIECSLLRQLLAFFEAGTKHGLEDRRAE